MTQDTKGIRLAERKPKNEDLEKLNTYMRGQAVIPIKSIQDKKLKGNLRRKERKLKDAAEKAVLSELLLTGETGYLEAEGMEKTYKFTQSQIAENVDLSTKAKQFELKLDQLGPYYLDYTRNGRHMLIGGKKGHVASFDWKTGKLGCELQLGETVRDIKWLHNETLFAVAQKKNAFIYDKSGLEVHCLKDHVEVNQLEFLPYHFLLASVGNSGWLKYQDVSTGKLVAELRTRLGRCDVMRQNPYNAILHLGHANGTVTLWSPNMSAPLVKMLCHKGPVTSLAIDRGGYYMASAGLDSQLKIWDIRMYKPVQEYFTHTPATCLDISQKGLLAVSYGPHVAVWKDAFTTKAQAPYMTHLQAGHVIQDMQFCPFEDVLGFGYDQGISSLIVPGAGEANFDSLELNPYQTKKQRQESEVHSLLEKIQPEMITLDPNFIGKVDAAPAVTLAEQQRKEKEKFVPKNKKRGRSTAMRRFLRKQLNVREERREALKAKLAKEKYERELNAKRKRGEAPPAAAWTALDVFSK